MLRLVFFLAVSCVLAWTAVWVVNDPGTVAVQWLDRELVLSVGTVIAVILAFAAAVIVLFELLRWCWACRPAGVARAASGGRCAATRS